MPERFDSGEAASDDVAMIVIINRRVLRISWKSQVGKKICKNFGEFTSVLMLSHRSKTNHNVY